MLLSNELDNVQQGLQENMAFEVKQMYSFRAARQLDLLMSVHVWYHHTCCELWGPWCKLDFQAYKDPLLATAPDGFLAACQAKLFFHANQISLMVQKVLEVVPDHDFPDVWLALCISDAARIQILRLEDQLDLVSKDELIELVKANMRVLYRMRTVHVLADLCVSQVSACG